MLNPNLLALRRVFQSPIVEHSSRSRPCPTCCTYRAAPVIEMNCQSYERYVLPAVRDSPQSPSVCRCMMEEGKESPYLGEGDVGNNDNVDGTGRVLGGGIQVAAGVVLVLALAGAGLPGHAGVGDLLLGCRRGGGTSCAGIRVSVRLSGCLLVHHQRLIIRSVLTYRSRSRHRPGRPPSRRRGSARTPPVSASILASSLCF